MKGVLRVCFLSKRLPPVVRFRFKSLSLLELSGFLQLVVGGFLWILWFAPHLHRLMFSFNEIKLEKSAVSALSKLRVERSAHLTRDMLRVICTQLLFGDLNVFAA